MHGDVDVLWPHCAFLELGPAVDQIADGGGETPVAVHFAILVAHLNAIFDAN